mgnify:CR=1 FL=1
MTTYIKQQITVPSHEFTPEDLNRADYTHSYESDFNGWYEEFDSHTYLFDSYAQYAAFRDKLLDHCIRFDMKGAN